MDFERRLPVLSVIWKLVVLGAFPILVWGYLQVTDLSFAELDTGTNVHKKIIFALYLALIIVWWWLNPKMQRLLHRRR